MLHSLNFLTPVALGRGTKSRFVTLVVGPYSSIENLESNFFCFGGKVREGQAFVQGRMWVGAKPPVGPVSIKFPLNVYFFWKTFKIISFEKRDGKIRNYLPSISVIIHILYT